MMELVGVLHLEPVSLTKMEQDQTAVYQQILPAGYSSVEFFNTRQYSGFNLAVQTSLGWESLSPNVGKKKEGLSGYLSVSRSF